MAFHATHVGIEKVRDHTVRERKREQDDESKEHVKDHAMVQLYQILYNMLEGSQWQWTSLSCCFYVVSCARSQWACRSQVSKELKIEETTALSFSSALPAIYACPNRHTA